MYSNKAICRLQLSCYDHVRRHLSSLDATIVVVVLVGSDYNKNVEFAQLVQQKLDAYRADDPNMGSVSGLSILLAV